MKRFLILKIRFRVLVFKHIFLRFKEKLNFTHNHRNKNLVRTACTFDTNVLSVRLSYV